MIRLFGWSVRAGACVPGQQRAKPCPFQGSSARGGGVVGVDEETEEETEEEEGSSSEVEADVEDAFEAWVQG